jgi:hypothetical protein
VIWLARVQDKDGGWTFDPPDAKDKTKDDRVAATGLALLPFLAAGQTHKPNKDGTKNEYQKVVANGLAFLLKCQRKDGLFANPKPDKPAEVLDLGHGMYSHAIATVAVCEALGISGDKALLRDRAQAAVNYVVAAQARDGSWGYNAGQAGDTSIVGWQVQALQSARMCKELVVDKRAFERARGFLNKVASGAQQSRYGYVSAGDRGDGSRSSLTLTAVGLLARYYADGWGPSHPGMEAGAAYLLKDGPPAPGKLLDMYYYYYATQVLHFREGPDWQRDWNPKMRDLLTGRQVTAGKTAGSWDPDPRDEWIGKQCGRLGTTCLALLTLEVYYRHLPLYKRGTGGLKELERVR